MQTETTIATAAPADAERAQILDLLETFIRSRPGLEFGNYGDVSAYRAESRAITKDRDHALTLLRYVRWTSIDAAALRAAFRDAYSGRLSLEGCTHGQRGRATCGICHRSWCDDCDPAPGALCHWCHGRGKSDAKPGLLRLSYCAGQYYPTEYRKAACAVLASAIWAYWRDGCMPEPSGYRVKLWASDSEGVVYSARAFAETALEESGDAAGYVLEVYGTRHVSAGDWLRAKARAEFGRAIARRWFN